MTPTCRAAYGWLLSRLDLERPPPYSLGSVTDAVICFTERIVQATDTLKLVWFVFPVMQVSDVR